MIINETQKETRLLLIGSSVFLLVALVEVIFGFIGIFTDEGNWINSMSLPPAIFPGLATLIIGLVWLVGYIEGKKKNNPSGYIIVGTILAWFFIMLFVSLLLTDVFNAYVLQMEDYAEWSMLEAIRWIMLLFPVPLYFTIKFKELFFSK